MRKTIELNQDDLDRVVSSLIMGLTTDGAHHKQYYLEAALEELCKKEFFDKSKKEFKWDDGIPS